MSSQPETTPPAEWKGELVVFVPVERVRTNLAVLRCPIPRPREDDLAELPARAVLLEDGFYELVDGFKRLERWRARGLREVPVVVERGRSVEELYALLLVANAPRRTVTIMDEARVVQALLARPEVGEKTVARVLGRRPWWVKHRRALAQKLVTSIQRRIDVGALRPTVAYALTRVAGRDQERVVKSVELAGLRAREALALVECFRSLTDEDERAALLRDPVAWVRHPPRTSSLGPVAEQLEERLARARRALEDLADFALPDAGLTGAERRRLEADWRLVLHQLRETARTLDVAGPAATQSPKEGTRHDERREDPRCGPAAGPAPDGAPGAPDVTAGAPGGAAADVPAHRQEEAPAARAAEAGDGGGPHRDPAPLARGGAGHEADRAAPGPHAQAGPHRGGGGAAGDQRGGDEARGAPGAGGSAGDGELAPGPLPRGDRGARRAPAHRDEDLPRDHG
jgi:ParB-like chromosome segregation protein Spo0J